jgi:hypothetical protein
MSPGLDALAASHPDYQFGATDDLCYATYDRTLLLGGSPETLAGLIAMHQAALAEGRPLLPASLLLKGSP